jgi:hypothetical protein
MRQISLFSGSTVLDLSKLLMMNFHYDFIKDKYPDSKSTLAFTDTDSLLYEIETENVYTDMREHHEHFDLSNYPDDHSIFKNDSPDTVRWLKKKNKKVVGKMKDEAGGDDILEFVGLRAKMYSYIQLTNGKISESKKLKGIKKSVVKKKIHFEHYKDCLFTGRDQYASMVSFRSKLHKISTIEQVKKSLSRFDDKRYILDDGISTRAHGHYLNI